MWEWRKGMNAAVAEGKANRPGKAEKKKKKQMPPIPE